VQQIVTDHGGTIWVEDVAPQGTRFVVELPVGRLTAAPVEPPTPVRAG
jgi:signal transduction histidine kinase